VVAAIVVWIFGPLLSSEVRMDTKSLCRCRGLENQGDEPRLSFNWLSARRDELHLTPAALEWGSWSIPYERIDDAMIYRYQMIIFPFAFPGRPATLVVWARGTSYHFQLPSISKHWYVLDPVWLGDVPFPLRFEYGSGRSLRRNNRRELGAIVIISALGGYLLAVLVGLMLYR
jgi:hypothetical protein